MTCTVDFAHSAKSNVYKNKLQKRKGKEIYRHPKGYFTVLEFEGKSGKFREAFRTNEVTKVK